MVAAYVNAPTAYKCLEQGESCKARKLKRALGPSRGPVTPALQMGGQTKPSALKVPGKLSGSMNLTPAYSERWKTATGPVTIQGDLIILFNHSRS